MSSGPKFPPAMQEWVTSQFQKMQKFPPAMRDAAREEMKKIIAHAYSTGTMLSIPWSTVQLTSLNESDPLKNLKRKTTDHAEGPPKKVQLTNNSFVPSVKPLKTNVFEDDARTRREKRFQREALIEQNRNLNTNHHTVMVSGMSVGGSLGARMQGFAHSHHHVPWRHVAEPVPDANVIDWDKYTIVGRSTSIFKNYLRLTSDPDPKDIRPLSVLRQTLEQLKQRWRSEGNYNWVCDQFKSLRQDLTVQRIKNEFTVQVYEIHARIALENSDLVEFNACQAMLRTLYELGLPGKREEFLGYRILYMLHGRNRADLNFLVSQLTPQEKELPAVQHALKAHMAMATGNYHQFFALFLVAPNMGGYIMDHYVDRERCGALITMAKSYRSLPLRLLQTELGYESDELPKLLDFLTKHSANVFTNPNAPDIEKHVACSAVIQTLIQVQSQKYAKVGIKGSV
ncbi:hypothetical protein FRC18_009157 [Serendipita sp. 400]|nr:hypothetical protein FRC18_009157 [Serendipita sp. 400]